MILPYIICVALAIVVFSLYLYSVNPVVQYIVRHSGWGFIVCIDAVLVSWFLLVFLIIKG